MQRYDGYARVLSSGAPVPQATVTVYLRSTLTLATLYSDDSSPPTALTNPLTADASGYFYFYAADNNYDVRFSNAVPSTGLIPTPYTWGDQRLHSSYSYVFNVMDFGATGDGSTNDTAAIQRAIDRARAIARGPALGTSVRTGCVFFPPGSYIISSLDCTDTLGLELRGKASWGVNLYASAQTGAGKPAIDLTGCLGSYFFGIQVHASDAGGGVPAVRPSTCWLIAEKGLVSNSTANRFENCGSYGFPANPAWYIYGGVDHVFDHCAMGFDNHASLSPSGVALYCSDTNDFAITSPYVTIATGTRVTSDLNFLECEIHGPNNVAATGQTIYLHNATALRFRGGLCDASGDRHVRFDGATNNDILFDGVKFYSESGHAATDLFWSNTAGIARLSVIAPIFDNAFTGNFLGGTVAAASGRIYNAAAAYLLGTGLQYFTDAPLAFSSVSVGAGTAFVGIAGSAASDAVAHYVVQRASRAIGLRVASAVSPGGVETYTVTLMVNNAATAITCTITGATTTAFDLTNLVTLAAGDTVSLRVVSSGGATLLTGFSGVLGTILV